jgi:hypothetical protein
VPISTNCSNLEIPEHGSNAHFKLKIPELTSSRNNKTNLIRFVQGVEDLKQRLSFSEVTCPKTVEQGPETRRYAVHGACRDLFVGLEEGTGKSVDVILR